MKQSEVVDLLAFMAAFDRRTVGEADVEAWSELDVIQRNTYATCKRAVVMFFDQEPDPYGRSPYLDPQQFRRFVRMAKAEAERNISRRRAVLVSTGLDVDEADAQARHELNPGGEGPRQIEEAKCICRVRGVADLNCPLHGVGGTRTGLDGQY